MIKRKSSASITVFLSLSFVLIAALILTITESARTIAQRYYMQTALNSAMESLFSEFHRPLWENYRIYALEYRDDALLQEELETFIKPYSEAQNLFPAKVVKDDFSFSGRGSLVEQNHFEEEVLEYIPALLTKDALEFIGQKQSGTDIPSLLEEVSKKEKEADSIQRLRKKYVLNHYDVEYLEDCINDIDQCCKNSSTLHSQSLSDLHSKDASGFFWHSSSLRSTLEQLKSTVQRYDARAEILKEKIAELRQDFELEKVNLEEDGIRAIESELQSYDEYVNEGGKVRQMIDLFPAECDSLGSSIQNIEETVQNFEDYISEERERRRNEDDDEEEDEDDLQAEIDAFYRSIAGEWQNLKMPVYGGSVTKINKKNKKYSKVSKNWEKRSSWNYSFPKEGNAPVPQSATQTPLLRQDPSPTPCRSDYWENIPYVTFTPITRRIMETPFLSVMQRDWRWNTYCTEKRATMRTSQRRSPLF